MIKRRMGVPAVLLAAAALTLSSAVCLAEEPAAEAPLEAIFENFLKEGSDYAEYRAMMGEYYDDVTFTETLGEDRITVAIDSKNEYMESGTWDFIQDGEYLTADVAPEDYMGGVLFSFLTEPVGEALGMDPVLYDSYLNGLQVLEMDSKYRFSETREDGGMLLKLYDAGPFELEGIDDMYVTEKVAAEYMTPLEGDDSFYSMPIGKIRFAGHGNAEHMIMAIGEFGENTERSVESLRNAVSSIHPAGSEAFLEAFTELGEMEGDGYKMTEGIDAETLEYLGITDDFAGFSFYTVEFGSEEGE